MFVAASAVLPAPDDLQRVHVRRGAKIHSIDDAKIADELLCGRIDLCFTAESPRHSELLTHRIERLSASAYCGPGHALYQRHDVPPTAVLRQDFVAPIPMENGPNLDGWPADLDRSVALEVTDELLVLELCRQGRYLALLPDKAAANCQVPLWRVPLDLTVHRPVFATHRPTLGAPGRAEALVHAVQCQLNGVASRTPLLPTPPVGMV